MRFFVFFLTSKTHRAYSKLQVSKFDSNFQCKTNTLEASIWPVGVRRMEWQNGCAGEIWQHRVTLTRVINSQAIKTRWSAAEVTLMLSQPRKTQPLLGRHCSVAVTEESSKQSLQSPCHIYDKALSLLCFVSNLAANLEHFLNNQLKLQNAARTESFHFALQKEQNIAISLILANTSKFENTLKCLYIIKQSTLSSNTSIRVLWH